jgi:hypothetical protein
MNLNELSQYGFDLATSLHHYSFNLYERRHMEAGIVECAERIIALRTNQAREQAVRS